MFGYTTAFEGKNLHKWDVSKVKNVFQMFFNAKSFNEDISGWKLI
ncbi:MAG: BspA family leucine-rich repeat surface protein [Tissierellia bacterium]|nr:BspA family leucine-rich repeat surface protein [Tissierellia bacterium]